MDYGFAHGGRVFTPNGTDVELAENDARNRAIDAAEVANWGNKPERMIAYLEGERVTTWMGVLLGVVTRRSIYRNNLGARIESVTVKGTNGAIYFGRKARKATVCVERVVEP